MIWQIQTFSEEYSVATTAQTPCLLIPGWSFDAGIFEWLLPGLAQQFVVTTAALPGLPESVGKDELVDTLAATIGSPTWIIGWSMGGNIAIEIAHRYPDKVLGLCLLATTPKFVQDSTWLVGMSATSYEAFRQSLLGDVAKALHKFDVLQTRGDANVKNLRHALQQYRQQQQPWSQASLVHGLTLLAEFDQRHLLPQLELPMLWCFGELDALVNAYTAYEVMELCPLADVKVIRQATHALFLTHPDTFFRALLRLLDKDKIQALKQKVAISFSRAAGSYDNAAILQRAVAQQLLAEVEGAPGVLLDAGCGTGYCMEQLQHRADCVVGVDMAHGMLLYGKSRHAAMRNALEADLECLPFAEHSIGQIFSSLAVQWCNAALFLDEWHRVLKPGGRVYIATLGENTLHELRQSWAMVDGQRHVNAFLSIEALCEEVYQSAFVLKKMHIENRVLAYGTVKELMHELKSIGAQTVVQGEQKGLMGRQAFARLEQAYETCRNEQGLLPATYEVIYMVLEKHL